MAIIYILKDPRYTDFHRNVRYVGYSTRNNPDVRLHEHIRDSKRFPGYVYKWVRALLSQGYLPEIELIDLGDFDTRKEDDYIRAYFIMGARLTNTRISGYLSISRPIARTRQNLSNALRAYYSNPDIRKALSQLNRTPIQFSFDDYQNYRLCLRGHPMTEENTIYSEDRRVCPP